MRVCTTVSKDPLYLNRCFGVLSISFLCEKTNILAATTHVPDGRVRPLLQILNALSDNCFPHRFSSVNQQMFFWSVCSLFWQSASMLLGKFPQLSTKQAPRFDTFPHTTTSHMETRLYMYRMRGFSQIITKTQHRKPYNSAMNASPDQSGSFHHGRVPVHCHSARIHLALSLVSSKSILLAAQPKAQIQGTKSAQVRSVAIATCRHLYRRAGFLSQACYQLEEASSRSTPKIRRSVSRRWQGFSTTLLSTNLCDAV